ncbi:MAG: hypothetical protein RLZZ522_750 [Verrucomicrobiota bacterium]
MGLIGELLVGDGTLDPVSFLMPHITGGGTDGKRHTGRKGGNGCNEQQEQQLGTFHRIGGLLLLLARWGGSRPRTKPTWKRKSILAMG